MLSYTTIRLERVTDWFTAINYEAFSDVATSYDQNFRITAEA